MRSKIQTVQSLINRMGIKAIFKACYKTNTESPVLQ